MGRNENSALKDYSAKRAFHLTPEPPPALAKRNGPLLFVVQKHDATRLHYDFRLEMGGVLKSWAVPKGPSLDPADKRMAVLTENHPFDYGSFEGVIPARQYGAGEVIVWDCGVYSPDEDQTYSYHDRDEAEHRMREGFARGKLSFQLRGAKLKGSYALVRTGDPKQWLLIKHKDRYAQPVDITERGESVLGGYGVADLTRRRPAQRLPTERLIVQGRAEALPRKLSPMLAGLGETLRNDPDWLYEPKLDGYRVLAFIDGGNVRLQSRRGLDLTPVFPEIAAQLARQNVETMVLDGEMVAFDEAGRPSFNALQNRAQLKAVKGVGGNAGDTPCVLYCFDLLHFAGINVRNAPYVDRRRYLTQCLLPDTHVQLVYASEDGEALYRAALESGFEGVIAKRKESKYDAGRRSPAWIKYKAVKTADFVVGGYKKGKGAREALGALLLGYWDDGVLRYAGHVGSGFSEATLAALGERFAALKTVKNPFATKPPLTGPTTWLQPTLVVEVKFAEWTPGGHLRAPVLLRVRDDLNPRAVTRLQDRVPATPATSDKPERTDGLDKVTPVLEQLDRAGENGVLEVEGQRIKLSHLNKVYWPADAALKQRALTKRDLLRYLAQMSPFMLPHLAHRPLTMIRMTEGIHGERFFQKHYDYKLPAYVDSVRVYSESKGERSDYVVCNNLPTLLWLGQIGTLEFHVWHSRVVRGPDTDRQDEDFASSLEALESSVANYPDYLVFDIDPYIYSGKEKPGDEPELNLTAFEKGKEVAFHLNVLLQEMNLQSIVKTSGKTGLHVFVPIERRLDFDATRQMCEMIGRHLMARYPKDITMEWAVKKRTGKIFMDYNMNVRGKTLNVAYSPRGLPGAAVSMPLAWDELEKAHPLDFRLFNAYERVAAKGDRWADALTAKQDLQQRLSITSSN